MERLLRISVQRCIGCGKCELACAFRHGSDNSTPRPRIEVLRRGADSGIPITCLQCEEPACAAACPVRALTRNPATFAIEVDTARCLKCRACLAACPFGNLRWDRTKAEVYKCDLCGGSPVCAEFCPTGALGWEPVRAPAKECAENLNVAP